MTTRDLFGHDPEAARARVEAAEQRLRDHEADFTPRDPTRIGLVALLRATGWLAELRALGRPIRVLDLCAGEGVWSDELRLLESELGLEVHITAVEIREEARPHLDRVADEVIIGWWQTALGLVDSSVDSGAFVYARHWDVGEHGIREYDLIIGNPPFSHARSAARATWPLATGPLGKSGRPTVTAAERRERARLVREHRAGRMPEGAARVLARAERAWSEMGLDEDAATRWREELTEALAEYDPEQSMPALSLRSSPRVALYTTQQCYTKTSSGWLARVHAPYAWTLDIPGSLGHRGRGRGQDDKPYTVFCWERGHEGPSRGLVLPPPRDRNFDHRPGTEPEAWRADRVEQIQGQR